MLVNDYVPTTRVYKEHIMRNTFATITKRFNEGKLEASETWLIETKDLARIYTLAERRKDKISYLEFKIASLELENKKLSQELVRAYYN